MTFSSFCDRLGMRPGHHVLIHSSFRRIRQTFPEITIESLIAGIQSRLTPSGSLCMPTFTYRFKRHHETVEPFNRLVSPSAVGAVSERFRTLPDTLRTSSPTHSFGLWGHITQTIGPGNNPNSPLGADSVPNWLTHHANSYILMLGVDFTSFTYGHYLEVKAPVPWADLSPWDHLGVEPVGLSVNGETPLRELPGCSRGFTRFEHHLLQTRHLEPVSLGSLTATYMPISMLWTTGIEYFKTFPDTLLCDVGTCRACDTRREKMILHTHTRLRPPQT